MLPAPFRRESSSIQLLIFTLVAPYIYMYAVHNFHIFYNFSHAQKIYFYVTEAPNYIRPRLHPFQP